MSTAPVCEPILEAGVADFLKKHAVEEEFQTTCQLIHTCFPQVRTIRAYLQEDPDEDDRWRVIVHMIVPPSHPIDRLSAQRRQFAKQLAKRLSPEKYPDPICRLLISFALA